MSPHRHIFNRNRHWSESIKSKDPHYFEELAKEQHPDYLFIGCSDSRVSADLVMGNEPGKVFVHQNIANLIKDSDLNSKCVIHYAVVHLKVRYIVICGHYGCGGVRAATSPEPNDSAEMEDWLSEVRSLHEHYAEELKKIESHEKRLNRLIELNVKQQVKQMRQNPDVATEVARRGYPIVMGWVYDIKDGLLKDLDA